MVKWARAAVACGWWAVAVLAPVGAHGAEAAADKKAAERWSDLTPLDAGISFENVCYPHLSKQGNVTFIADDPMYTSSQGTNHGIYPSQADGKVVCLVRGGETTVPGMDTTLTLIRGLQMDEDGDDFIFNATDSNKKRGVYRWSKGKLETVARTDVTILAGETDPIISIEYGALHGTRLLYQAMTAEHNTVLVLHDLTADSDRILCRTGMSIPGHDDQKFPYIALQNWLDGDSIIFRAASVADPDEPDARGTIGIYGWFGIKDWTGASGELAPERVRTILDGDTRVPIHGVPPDTTFDHVSSTPVDGNIAAFEGSGEGFHGLFIARTPDRPLRCLVSTHTEFGGPFKGHFTGFSGYPTVIGQNLIFTAEAAEGEANDAPDDDGAGDANADKTGATYQEVSSIGWTVTSCSHSPTTARNSRAKRLRTTRLGAFHGRGPIHRHGEVQGQEFTGFPGDDPPGGAQTDQRRDRRGCAEAGTCPLTFRVARSGNVRYS